MRSRFDEQLMLLNKKMIEMGAECENIISLAVNALLEGDVSGAKRAKEQGHSIDQLEREIESVCLKLLLQQQPVAKDLRVISAALKMITDMERIGDQAEDIAEIIGFLNGRTGRECHDIRLMAEATIKMVTDSIDAYVNADLDMAQAVMKADDVVDDYFLSMRDELVSAIRRDSAEADHYLDLLMITKYLERIGDHAVNIAEWVEYSITGVRRDDEIPESHEK